MFIATMIRDKTSPNIMISIKILLVSLLIVLFREFDSSVSRQFLTGEQAVYSPDIEAERYILITVTTQ